MENLKKTTEEHLVKNQYKNYWKVGLAALIVLIFGYMLFGGDKPAFLVSVTAEDGVAIGAQDADGCFNVTLKGADSVIWFTDRPEREAGSTGVDFLVDTWQEEFGDNPPNADLQLFDENGEGVNMVLVLESTPTFGAYGHTLTFDKACPIFSIDDSESDSAIGDISGKTFSKGVLFIDDFLGIGKAFTALGDAINHEAKHSTTAIAKKINFGGWEEKAAANAQGIIELAAKVGGAAGKSGGGSEGERVGSRVGAELGVVVVQTTASIAFGADVDGSSLIDPHDFAEAIKESLYVAGGHLNYAHTLTKKILDAQRDEMRANFFDSLNNLSIEYDKQTFCGRPITENNALFNTFMYYLELKLEARIYYDLKSGMNLDELKEDVNANMAEDVRYSLLRALWELQYYCVYDEDDLFTPIFIETYVIQYTARMEKFPQLGIGYGVGPGWRPPTERIRDGYPTEAAYQIELQRYYDLQESAVTRGDLPPDVPGAFSVYDAVGPELQVIQTDLEVVYPASSPLITATRANPGYPASRAYYVTDTTIAGAPIPTEIGNYSIAANPLAPAAPQFEEVFLQMEEVANVAVVEEQVVSGITNLNPTYTAMVEANTVALLEEANAEFVAAQDIFLATGVSPYEFGVSAAAESAVVDESMIARIVEDSVVDIAIETAPEAIIKY